MTGSKPALPPGADADAFGVVVQGPGARVTRNLIWDTVGAGEGSGFAVVVSDGDGTQVLRNRLGNRNQGSSTGVRVEASSGVVVNTNRFANFSYGIVFTVGATGTYTGNTFVGVPTPYVGGTPGP